MPFSPDRRAFVAGLPLAAAALGFSGSARAQMPGQVEVVESQYSTIYVTRSGQMYSMVFGINQKLFTESLYNAANPRELPVDYTRFMTAAVAYPPAVNNVLEIGLGGGRTAEYLHHHMATTTFTCVELDKAVITLAKKYFGFQEDARLRAIEEDGRRFFARDRGRYDIIMVDAYRGTFVPFHLLTKEYFTIVKSRLNPGGVVAQNIEPCTMLYPAAINTLKAVFANVEIYEASGNVVAIAYDGPEKTREQLGARAGVMQRTNNFYHPLPELMRGRKIVRRPMPGGQVLIDDFAPAEALAGVQRGNNRDVQSRTGLCR